MFREGETGNLWIDKSIFTHLEIELKDMDYENKHYHVMAIVGLLTISDRARVFTTTEIILMTMANNLELKLKPKVIKGILYALNNLSSKGIITINEEVKKLNQLIMIDMGGLLHKKGESYFQVSRYEIQQIMKSSTPQHLFTLYCNLASRWNMESYVMYDEYGWDKKEDRYYDTNLQLYKYLSCYPTQEELTTTWCSRPNEKGESGFNCIERRDKWEVSRISISNYIGELVDLGVISRVTKNSEGKNRNYYCRPQHKVCVSQVLEILEEQKEFSIKNEKSCK